MKPVASITAIKAHAVRVWLLVLLVSAAVPVSATERRPVWNKLDQYVALEPQETVQTGALTPNNHPAHVPPAQIRDLLSTLQVVMEEGEKPVALFSEWELEVLPPNVSEALANARANEDVVFALTGLHASFAFLKQSMVTTGRVFVTGNRLNLILGQVHEPVSDRDDRRLKPFVPGSRLARSSAPWRIVDASGTPPETATARHDWIRLAPKEHVHSPAPAHQPKPAMGIAEAVPAPPPPRLAAPPPGKSAEERLRLLKDLHDKKLITDEEFQTKRREVLSDI